MLKDMTKEFFMENISGRKFAVIQKAANRTAVYTIVEGEQHDMVQVVNPDSKDGWFAVDSKSEEKALETLEEIAMYIDRRDKDRTRSCLTHLTGNQIYIYI